jgi:enoyl-CoA hydratase/carnithine racemase
MENHSMVMSYQKEGKIGIITLNRPEVHNALNSELAARLMEAWNDFNHDPNLLALVITGAGGRAFCVGADLKERSEGKDPHVDDFWKSGSARSMREMDFVKPVIAAIHGYCLGGGLELALTCDLRVASDQSLFGLPEIKRGFFPGMGASQRLPRVLPYNYAAELLFTGDFIDAKEAYRLGLVNRVVADEEVMPVAMNLAGKISRRPPLALRAVKEALLKSYDLSLAQGLRLEGILRHSVGQTEDAREGVKAFVEKRTPEYKGR